MQPRLFSFPIASFAEEEDEDDAVGTSEIFLLIDLRRANSIICSGARFSISMPPFRVVQWLMRSSRTVSSFVNSVYTSVSLGFICDCQHALTSQLKTLDFAGSGARNVVNEDYAAVERFVACKTFA